MDVRDEKATAAVEETDPSKASAQKGDSMDKSSNTDSAEAEKPTQHMSDDQYPHGLKVVLLAGASIVAVFLIALDQVSIPPTITETVENTTNRTPDYHWYSRAQNHRRVP